MLERDQGFGATQLAEATIVARRRLAVTGRDLDRFGVAVAVGHEEHVDASALADRLLDEAAGAERLVVGMRRHDEEAEMRRHRQGLRGAGHGSERNAARRDRTRGHHGEPCSRDRPHGAWSASRCITNRRCFLTTRGGPRIA